MKRTLFWSVLALILLMAFILYESHNGAKTAFLASNASYPIYGESSYFSIINDVKISVEKIIQERYFIIYSWSTGDQSYFGVTLLVENTKKQPLSKSDFKTIWLVDDQGYPHQPIPYFEILDFPEDQPLGWKQVVNCKFWPLKPDTKYIDIYVKYGKNTFAIKNIRLK